MNDLPFGKVLRQGWSNSNSLKSLQKWSSGVGGWNKIKKC